MGLQLKKRRSVTNIGANKYVKKTKKKKNIHKVCRSAKKHGAFRSGRIPISRARTFSVVSAAVSPSTETGGGHFAEWSADNLHSKTMSCTITDTERACVLSCSRRPRGARRSRVRRTSPSPVTTHKTLRNAPSGLHRCFPRPGPLEWPHRTRTEDESKSEPCASVSITFPLTWVGMRRFLRSGFVDAESV